MPEPVSFRGGAGVISALRWPGRTNVGLLLAHATGFCKEVWTPLVDVLREGYDGSVTAWDSRGHGESEPGELPFDWWDFAADVHAVIQQSSDAKRFGMGHSMGGAALAMAEILRPGTFEALVLIEPIVFRPPFGRFENPMVDGALRRKAVFPSPSAAFSNFASKPAFARWDVEVMDAYVQGALVDEAGDWRLRCRPEHEADVYRGGSAHGAYERLEEMGRRLGMGLSAGAAEAGVPLTVVQAGSTLTAFFRDSAPTNYAEATTSDTEAFGRFHRAMLERGIHLAPSQYEGWFLSLAHDETLIDRTIEAARESFVVAAG